MKKRNEKTSEVYQVDMLRLTVKTYKLTDDVQHSSTFEDFNMSQCKSSITLDLNIDQLPKKIGNYIYFENNDEALKYIKTLIGM